MNLYGNVSGLYNASTITWSQISGPAVTIGNVNSLTTTCGLATAGATYVFRISATCTDANVVTNNVTYTVTAPTPAPPAAVAGATINAGCKLFGSPIALNATPAPTGFIGTWTLIKDFFTPNVAGVFSNPNSATSNFIPSQIVIGSPNWTCTVTPNTYKLRWTLVSTTPPPVNCPTAQTSTFSDVIVNAAMYNPLDVRVITPGCGNASTTTYLYGTCSGDGTSAWSLVSGPAGYVYAGVSTQNATLSGLSSGTYTFRYTTTGTCAAGTKDVTFTIANGTNFAVTSSNANLGNITTGFCGGSMPASLQLAANAPNVGETGTWVSLSGGTTVSFSPNANDPNAVITRMTKGGSPYTLRWVISSALGCTSATDITLQYVNPLAGASLNLKSICDISTFNSDYQAGPPYNNCTPNVYKDFIFIGYSLFQGQLGYYDDGWELKAMNLATKPTGASDTYGFTPSNYSYSGGRFLLIDCAGSGFYFTLSLNGLSGNTLNVYHQFPFTPGSYTGTLVMRNSLCGAEATIPFKIDLSHDAFIANAGTDQNLACNVVSTNLSGNNPIVTTPFFGAGTWSQISGPNTAVIADKNDRSSLISSLVAGTYSFMWSIGSGDFCPPKQDTVVVKVSTGLPSAITAGAN